MDVTQGLKKDKKRKIKCYSGLQNSSMAGEVTISSLPTSSKQQSNQHSMCMAKSVLKSQLKAATRIPPDSTTHI